jgi:hypothetical protein
LFLKFSLKYIPILFVYFFYLASLNLCACVCAFTSEVYWDRSRISDVIDDLEVRMFLSVQFKQSFWYVIMSKYYIH